MNNTPTNNEHEQGDEEYIESRTEQKKSMQQYVDIGKQLLNLSNKQLSAIPLNNEVLDALETAKKISVGNALKRQLSFLAKLIRKSDYESIQAALDSIQLKDKQYDLITQKTEQWRDRLLEGEAGVLSQFIEKYACDERQKLGQITRHAIKEAKKQQQEKDTNGKIKTPSKYKKQLFSLLRTHIANRPY
ncbi:ribosome biogenesis factor YjgA [Eionea flava]